jgi:hypothetical protein
MLSSTTADQHACRRWLASVRQRARRRGPAVSALLLALGLAALLSASPVSAAPAYPPRANCALTATADPTTGSLSVEGSGFAPGQAVHLSVRTSLPLSSLASPISDGDGSFSVTRQLAHQLHANATVWAQSQECTTDVALQLTDAPTEPSTQPSKHPGSSAFLPPAQGLSPLATTLPTAGLGPQLFLGLIAAVTALAVSLFLIAGRAGRRDQ